MATLSEPPSETFRLTQLIYDTRYRSLTIQVAALIGFLVLLSWLVSNTVANLEALGKDFNFRFLFVRSGYDINQTPIAYTSDSSHLRAAQVGILNTLLVAFFGCILATIFGVLAGVLRLSKNWLTARLMTVYVEGFRNVPVVLWIIVMMAILTNSTPAPNEFRGETPTASMLLDGTTAITNRGTYVPKPVFEAGSFAVGVVFLASLVGIWAFGRYARRRQEATGEQLPTFWIKLGIFALPTLVAYFVLGRPISLDYPELRGFNFQGGFKIENSFTALWIGLSLYTGAFIAENVRAGVMAISRGQTEAAYALGLRPGRTMSLVVLPQALRVIIPPLISQYLNLTKNTSLGLAVSYMDLRSTLGGITLNQTGRELECMLLMMSIYLVISLIVSAIMNAYNRSVRLKER
jgi:general L-amino acid transport system permease protein